MGICVLIYLLKTNYEEPILHLCTADHVGLEQIQISQDVNIKFLSNLVTIKNWPKYWLRVKISP